ncbi:MAG: TonB-dependent receptor [Flavobacteriales bacterium]|nr:TonB-dependent receptor [Flavobacteriales bacterium]MCX7768250.1 TonB-dependent receptor [Flavobacteriales bacterium]MDW8410589.1 TonB-dependent receptor [Flavobacteriales bacterium]
MGKVRLFHLLLAWMLGAMNVLIAQKGTITGVVIDKNTRLPLIGAHVLYEPLKGTSTDIYGKFTLKIPPGTYTLTVSYVGYQTQTRQITVEDKPLTLEFALENNTLSEVEVVSDIARPRETPVAYSNIGAERIAEQAGTQDLPMLLNATPGVYATTGSGGDGAARVSIRGFSQQNVLVLIDGIPMNDMHNGRVYWTNWFGLGNNTQTIQVQRGLGASKLAIPAVGGTINVMTSTLQKKPFFAFRQEVGNRLNFNSTVVWASGMLKGNWSIQGGYTARFNQGWVDKLWSRMHAFYLRVDKIVGKHQITFNAFGAPQTSAQRDFRLASRFSGIVNYDTTLARELGILVSQNVNPFTTHKGIRYNPSWGRLRRTRADEGGPNAKEQIINSSVNQYFKPVVSLRDFIEIDNTFYLSLIGYASLGIGGGTTFPVNTSGAIPVDSSGQINFQAFYDANKNNIIYNTTGILAPYYGKSRSTEYIRKDYNQHQWYGFLGTFDKKLTEWLSLNGGLDFRYYQGRVFSRIHDLLGGDLIRNSDNNNLPEQVLFKGDKVRQDKLRHIFWGGAFATAEIRKEKYSAFLNASMAYTGYRQLDYFLPRQYVDASGQVHLVKYGDTLQIDGKTITTSSPETRVNQSDFVSRLGFTVKGGFNYNIDAHQNVFVNVGTFSRAPYMDFIIRADNRRVLNSKNERIVSAEWGYTMAYKHFAANLNMYYTLWLNRPTPTTLTVDGVSLPANATGLRQRHMGVELDFIYIIIPQLHLEGMVSLGDWIYASRAVATATSELTQDVVERTFDATGVRVGDAAQHTYAASIRIMPVKGMYVQPRFNYFARNWSNFTANELTKEVDDNGTILYDNERRQSWRMPNYWFMDLFAGYGFKASKRIRLDFRASFFNLTNNVFISDATNNGMAPAQFNANSATVYFGLGFRWNAGFQITFQ